MSLTKRDVRVIEKIGKHGILSRQQIQELFFPSYATCQRRLREELIPGNYVMPPYYYNRNTPIYRLGKEGRRVCDDYRNVTLGIQKIRHNLILNDVVIGLRLDEYEIEKKIGRVIGDIITGQYCIEIDLGTEPKDQIMEKFTRQQSLDRHLVWVSNRKTQLAGWYQYEKKAIFTDWHDMSKLRRVI